MGYVVIQPRGAFGDVPFQSTDASLCNLYGLPMGPCAGGVTCCQGMVPEKPSGVSTPVITGSEVEIACAAMHGTWNAATQTCTPPLTPAQQSCKAAGGAWDYSKAACNMAPVNCKKAGGTWSVAKNQCVDLPVQPLTPVELPPAPPPVVVPAAPAKKGLSTLAWAGIVAGAGAVGYFALKPPPKGKAMTPNRRRRHRR